MALVDRPQGNLPHRLLFFSLFVYKRKCPFRGGPLGSSRLRWEIFRGPQRGLGTARPPPHLRSPLFSSWRRARRMRNHGNLRTSAVVVVYSCRAVMSVYPISRLATKALSNSTCSFGELLSVVAWGSYFSLEHPRRIIRAHSCRSGGHSGIQ